MHSEYYPKKNYNFFLITSKIGDLFIQKRKNGKYFHKNIFHFIDFSRQPLLNHLEKIL
jgi:hypothetical protein